MDAVNSHPLAPFPRGSLWHIAHHFAPRGLPVVPLQLAPTPVCPEDAGVCERVLAAYHRAVTAEQKRVRPENRPNDGVWESLKHEFHGEILRLLARRDVPALAEYLSRAMRADVGFGLGPGSTVFEACADPQTAASLGFLLLDRVAALGEAVGALAMENPEQGRYGENVYLPLPQMLEQLEETVGFPIDRPRVMGIFGFETGGRLFDLKVPDDAYSSYRVRQIAQQYGCYDLCEIGGGFGGFALYAMRAGLRSVAIVDLPLINVLQGYFLIKTLGADDVRLFGEPRKNQRVQVLPYWEFHTAELRFNLVFNRDSMAEIPLRNVLEYLAEIERRGVMFLSINQEATALASRPGLHHLNVHDICAGQTRLRLLSRHPYWMRKGYTEELYK